MGGGGDDGLWIDLGNLVWHDIERRWDFRMHLVAMIKQIVLTIDSDERDGTRWEESTSIL